ncbi:MAG: hypothetical protein PHU49_01320 [Syntrophorhabdaceae bacterium]|nr:hypothetical protein [Syntrophorhabdaceae bacterium]MDD5242631.1 hypothetical protein [Syntrophorhabdaceae bacterium]
MTYALKALFVKGGLICMVDKNYADWLENITPDDTLVNLADDGLAVIIENREKPENNIIIPLPDELLDYLIDNRELTVYTFSENYIEKPASRTFEISRDLLLEGRAIYRYNKIQQRQEGSRQQPLETSRPEEKLS